MWGDDKRFEGALLPLQFLFAQGDIAAIVDEARSVLNEARFSLRPLCLPYPRLRAIRHGIVVIPFLLLPFLLPRAR